MAGETIIIKPEESEPPPQPEKDSDDTEMKINYGRMIESHHQAQARITTLEAQLAEMRNSGEASRAEIRALEAKIDQLTAALAAEAEEEEQEEVTEIQPPEPETPKEEEKPAPRKSMLEKFLFG
jgi:hypothetical protein